jgi:2-polyprenyl-6-hydroxyphenyl methylase/3-demethylubiquinone-9 3-methyltransferase
MNDAIAWHSEIAPAFDARYARSAAFKDRIVVWSTLIERFVDGKTDVLDAGCGPGVLSALASRRARSVFAFDASPEMIALAESRKRREVLANTTFRTGVVEDPAIVAGRKFDVVLCSSVLEYVVDFWHAFDCLEAALRPGGILVFSLPNTASLYRKLERVVFRLTGHPTYYRHVRNLPSPQQVNEGLAARKLAILALQYYAATPGLSAMARGIRRPDLADNLVVRACRRPA